MRNYLLMSLLLSGCAGAPKFQKLSEGTGYSVTQHSDNNIEVMVSLPANSSEKAIEDYGALAIGEECKEKGFAVWDYGKVSSNKFEGQCYKTNEFKGLGLTFYKEGLEKEPSRFVVEKINNKVSTKILKEDEVLMIDDKKVSSMAQIKSLIYSKKETESILVSVRRNNKVLSFAEPLVTYKDLMLDQKVLAWLRDKFN